MMSTERARRGYTIIEVMMALTILAIGVSGIVAMQKVTVAANQHAKNMAIAAHIAQAWQEQLEADASKWNHPSPNNATRDIDTDTTWLQQVDSTADWFRPSYSTVLQFGAGFDALGNPVTDGNVADAPFCVNVRLNWLYPDAAGNGLVRAEVRVFWLREGMGGNVNNAPICSPAVAAATITQNYQRYHFVYLTSAIKEQTSIE
jgi:prepilin-type N-terminal cleavage/methylation domain-containing protein